MPTAAGCCPRAGVISGMRCAARAGAGLALACLLALPVLLPRPAEARAAPLESELPTPAGTYDARAVAVNDSGVIAGRTIWATPEDFARGAAGVQQAVVWTPSGRGTWLAQELPGLQGTIEHEAASSAYGINSAGKVVGWAIDPTSPTSPRAHAVVWDHDGHGVYGVPIDIGAQVGNTTGLNNMSAALAINTSGEIVGCVGQWQSFAQAGFGECRDDYHDKPNDPDMGNFFTAQPVVWTPTASGYAARYLRLTASPDPSQDPGDYLPSRGRATGINDAGQIVGEVDLDGASFSQPVEVQLSRHAVVWSPSSVPDLSAQAPAAPVSSPPGVSVTASAPWLPMLLPSPAVDGDSQALGINNAGQIVGSAGGHAALWKRSTGLGTSYALTQLPDAGTSSVARAASDGGLIVGSELLGDGGVDSFPLTWEASAPGGGYEAVSASVDRGGPYGQADGVNSRGLIAGDVHTRPYDSRKDPYYLDYTATQWYPAAVPGPPVIDLTIPDDGQVLVFFVTPQSDGGSPILHYTVTASPGGRTATGQENALTVTGLTDGTAYTFTVTATNAVGTGPPSAASDPVTPLGPPGTDAPPLTPTDWSRSGIPPLLSVSRPMATSASGPAPSAAPAAVVAPPPFATPARAPLVGTFTGGRAAGSGGGGGSSHGHGSDDRFLLITSVLVAGAAGVAGGGWFGWQRGWAAATRRRLAGWWPRRGAEASAW